MVINWSIYIYMCVCMYVCMYVCMDYLRIRLYTSLHSFFFVS